MYILLFQRKLWNNYLSIKTLTTCCLPQVVASCKGVETLGYKCPLSLGSSPMFSLMMTSSKLPAIAASLRFLDMLICAVLSCSVSLASADIGDEIDSFIDYCRLKIFWSSNVCPGLRKFWNWSKLCVKLPTIHTMCCNVGKPGSNIVADLRIQKPAFLEQRYLNSCREVFQMQSHSW